MTLPEIETVPREEIPEANLGRPGTGKYEPIRQAILALPPGEVAKLDLSSPREAWLVQIALLSAARGEGNSLHGKPLRTSRRGATLYAWLDEEGA